MRNTFGGCSVYELYFQVKSTKGEDGTPYAWSEFPPDMLQLGRGYYVYIIDFDRDAFSVDFRWHFRLSNIPTNWLAALEETDTILGPECLAWDVLAPIPVVEQELLAKYKRYKVTEIEPPEPSG
jgi:hypothetical protein